MKKADLAYRLWELDQAIKGMEDERAEIRETLAKKLVPGASIAIETAEGPFRVKLCPCEEKVLKSNDRILHNIGLNAFLKAAKVGCGALKEALKGVYDDGEKVEQVFSSCILAVTTKNTLKLLRG